MRVERTMYTIPAIYQAARRSDDLPLSQSAQDWTHSDNDDRHMLLQRMQNLMLQQKVILDNASVGIALIKDQTIHSCNPYFATMLGWEMDELVGQPSNRLDISQQHWQGLREALGDKIFQGEVGEIEIDLKRKDGSNIRCIARGKSVSGTDPELGYVWIIEDVTLQRSLEQKLKQAHEDLELRVLERTEEIHQANVLLEKEAQERKEVERRIVHLAYHDALTGLPNRMLLEDRVRQAMHNADRRGTQFALAYIDLDEFKLINDTMGHEMGDALLTTMAERVNLCMRATDTLSRQGGDEFVVLVNDLQGVHDLEPLLERIMACLREPVALQGRQISVTASMGVACYPADARDFSELRRKADMAMYSAKGADRNTYRFFSDDLDIKAHAHARIRSALAMALERNELALHYQPQLNLISGEVIGVEALLRWNSAELGAVSPAEFIPVAEDSGLIVSIGTWVLQQACEQAVRWHQAGFGKLRMAVNCSAEQFRRSDMLDTVTKVLAQTGIQPELLELELTESTLIYSADQMQICIKALKAMGVRISIDDFGTGYSSLSYLRQLAVDKLKIDQSFVRDLNTDADNAALSKAIIQMAQSLGLRTIAEGIETVEVANTLLAMSCDEVQGYFFARPMPTDAVTSFLLQRKDGAHAGPEAFQTTSTIKDSQ